MSASQEKLYVGNLAYGTSSDDLSELFEKYGPIVDAKVIIDRESGRSKGFGFVTFADAQAAQEALALDGSEFQGRHIKVNVAKESTGGGSAGPRKSFGPRRSGSGGPMRRNSERDDRGW